MVFGAAKQEATHEVTYAPTIFVECNGLGLLRVFIHLLATGSFKTLVDHFGQIHAVYSFNPSYLFFQPSLPGLHIEFIIAI